MPCDDFQLAVLSSIVKKIKRVPLRRVLSLYGVEYNESDSLKKLCKKLKGYIIRLRKGKRAEAQTEKCAESVKLQQQPYQLSPPVKSRSGLVGRSRQSP